MSKVFQPLSKLMVNKYSDLNMKRKHPKLSSKMSSLQTHKNSKIQDRTMEMNGSETRNTFHLSCGR